MPNPLDTAEQAHQRARQHILADRLAEAGTHFQQAAALDPANATYAFDLAIWLERSGNVPSALETYRQVLSIDAQHTDAALNLSGGLLQLKRPHEALAVLRALPPQAIKANAELGNTFGSALLHIGDTDNAIAAFQQALAQAPDFLGAASNLGAALLQARRYEQALATLQEVASRHPENDQAQLNLAIVKLELGFAKEARQLLLHLRRRRYDSPKLRQGLASTSPQLSSAMEGRHLRLRPFSGEQAAFIQSAFNNRAFTRRMGRTWTVPGSLAALETQLEQHRAAPLNSRSALEWVVEDRRNGQPIGIAVLTDISWANSKGEFSLGFVEPSMALSSLSLEAALLTLDLAFNQVCLKKLVSYVYHDNPRAQENTLSLGFSQEGFVREQMFDESEQRWLSLFLNAMLEADFRANPRLGKLSRKLLGRSITDDIAANVE